MYCDDYIHPSLLSGAPPLNPFFFTTNPTLTFDPLSLYELEEEVIYWSAHHLPMAATQRKMATAPQQRVGAHGQFPHPPRNVKGQILFGP